MQNNSKIVFALLLVGLAAGGVLFYLAASRSGSQTEEATATVITAARESKRGDDDTILTLSYQAGRTVAQARARIDGVHASEYPAGRQVRICYDPDDTSSVRVENGRCG